MIYNKLTSQATPLPLFFPGDYSLRSYFFRVCFLAGLICGWDGGWWVCGGCCGITSSVRHGKMITRRENRENVVYSIISRQPVVSCYPTRFQRRSTKQCWMPVQHQKPLHTSPPLQPLHLALLNHHLQLILTLASNPTPQLHPPSPLRLCIFLLLQHADF